MLRTYEFKLKPTRPQQRRLLDVLDASRHVYNWALEDRRNLHGYAKCPTSLNDQSRFLKELRKQKPWLEDVHVHVLQTALKRLDLAFQAFFRRAKAGRKPGYPRFKGRDRFDSFSFKEEGNGFRLDGKRLRLSKVGRVRVRLHREIPGEARTCTVKRRADGWFALFVVEVPNADPNPLFNPVGIDVGLNSFAVLSTGERVENPRLLKKAQSNLKREQRSLSRKKRGSNGRRKQRARLARKHLKIQRCRKDYHCKVASNLVRRFNPIFVERLDIRGLVRKAVEDKRQRKKIRAKSENILDAAWGMFVQRLGSKAENAGSVIETVEPRGTSQGCSRCGATVRKVLDERIHSCYACGMEMDRDLNAAVNILNRGMEKTTGGTTPVGTDSGWKPNRMNLEAAPLEVAERHSCVL